MLGFLSYGSSLRVVFTNCLFLSPFISWTLIVPISFSFSSILLCSNLISSFSLLRLLFDSFCSSFPPTIAIIYSYRSTLLSHSTIVALTVLHSTDLSGMFSKHSLYSGMTSVAELHRNRQWVETSVFRNLCINVYVYECEWVWWYTLDRVVLLSAFWVIQWMRCISGKKFRWRFNCVYISRSSILKVFGCIFL